MLSLILLFSLFFLFLPRVSQQERPYIVNSTHEESDSHLFLTDHYLRL